MSDGIRGGIVTLALTSLLIWAPEAQAYLKFSYGCYNCHGPFFGVSYTSSALDDPVEWGVDLHDGHRTVMLQDSCDACHDGYDFSEPNTAEACTGCHGREDDAELPDSLGPGTGLIAHHMSTGASSSCAYCHMENLALAAGEDVQPANFGGLGWDACNLDDSETQFGSYGLDNDGDGDRDMVDLDCAFNQPPIADPGGPYSGDVGVVLTFDGSGSFDLDGAIASYEWDFGDGTAPVTVTTTTVGHAYPAGGVHVVTLTVTDDQGAASEPATTAADINAPPTADPGGPYGGIAGNAIAFDGTGSIDQDGTIVAYHWTFGDGASGAGAQHGHSYATAGSYAVSLRVTDDDGAEHVSGTTAVVAARQGPRADAGGPYYGTIDTPVVFDGSGSSDPDDDIATFHWDFGDGTVVPDGGPTPNHAYISEGRFDVTLTVTDGAGLNDADQTTVDISLGPQPPVADPGAPYAGTAGMPVSFDGTGSYDPDGGTIDAYAWDFGDGGTATGATPLHVFAEPGLYTVTLMVTDDEGTTSPPSETSAEITRAATADLAIEKDDGLTTAKPRDDLTYVVTVRNLGPDDVAGAGVTDLLPAALSDVTWRCVADAGAACPAEGQGDVAVLVDLPAGAAVVFEITATVEPGASGRLTNTAMVAPPPGFTDPNPANDAAADHTDIEARVADLSITKSDGREVAEDSEFVDYVIRVSNTGPDDVAGAIVADDVPVGLASVTWVCSADPAGTCGAAGTGDLADVIDLPAGSAIVYTVSGTIDAVRGSVIENLAVVTAPPEVVDPDPSDNAAVDQTRVGELVFECSFERSFEEIDAAEAPLVLAEPWRPELIWSQGAELGHLRWGHEVQFRLTVRRASGLWWPGSWQPVRIEECPAPSHGAPGAVCARPH